MLRFPPNQSKLLMVIPCDVTISLDRLKRMDIQTNPPFCDLTKEVVLMKTNDLMRSLKSASDGYAHFWMLRISVLEVLLLTTQLGIVFVTHVNRCRLTADWTSTNGYYVRYFTFEGSRGESVQGVQIGILVWTFNYKMFNYLSQTIHEPTTNNTPVQDTWPHVHITFVKRIRLKISWDH